MHSNVSFIPCEVTAYSGYRGDERPTALVVEGREIEILGLRMIRIEEDFGSRMRKRLFEVQARDGRTYLLSHDETSGRWALRTLP